MNPEIIRHTKNEALAAIEKEHGPKASAVVRQQHIVQVATATGETKVLQDDIAALPTDQLAAVTQPANLLARILKLEKSI